MKNETRLKITSFIMGLAILTVMTLPVSPKDVLHYDSYGKLPLKDDLGRLDGFLIYLRRNDLVGYIIFYVGKNDSYKKEKKRIERGVKHLVEFRKFDKKRLVIIYAGSEENTRTYLYGYEKDNPLLREGFPKGKNITAEIKSLKQ